MKIKRIYALILCILTIDSPPNLSNYAESYPQDGQEKVDLGGWTFTDDSLAKSGTAKLEYKSGVGNFAKFLNGKK